MASRTVKQWYQFIIDEKESLSSLDALEPNPETITSFQNDLKTQSAVAIWRLSAWIAAFMGWTLEILWDTKEAEIQKIQDETPPHTKSWWEKRIKAFQFGDPTIVDSNGLVTYETIDTTKQIVSRTNVKTLVPVGGDAASVNVKVAKLDGTGDHVVFTAAEQSSFDAYVNDLKPLGVKTTVTHSDPGNILLGGYIWYDPSILNVDLTRIDDNSINALDVAMDKYINEWAMVNSKLNENEMIDYILAEEGIIDIKVDQHQWREDPGSAYVNVDGGGPANRKEIEIDSVSAKWVEGTLIKDPDVS